MKTQQSLRSLLRKRLEEGRQSQNLQQTISKFTVTSTDLEDLRKDIQIACTLYLRYHHPLYINYMQRGIALFRGMLNLDAPEYKDFYPFSFLSICVCGKIQAIHGCAILHGCYACKSYPRISLDYEIFRLESKLNIHNSWLKLGFATAIHILKATYGYEDTVLRLAPPERTGYTE